MAKYICVAWELEECPVGDLLRLEDGEKPKERIKRFFKDILQADDPNYEYDDEDVEDYCVSRIQDYFEVEPVAAEKLLNMTSPNWASLSIESFDIACHSMMLYVCVEFAIGEPQELEW